MILYAKDTVELIRKAQSIVIYGARIVAKEVATCLMGEPYNLKIDGFIVSDLNNNPSEIYGIKVTDIINAKDKYQNSLVIVAVLERYLDDILKTLNDNGFNNVISMTFESDLWSYIRGNFYYNYCIKNDLNYLTLDKELEKLNNLGDSNKVRIYMAKCHVDKNLNSDLSSYDCETPIQVGAALTDIVISDIRDNMGDNISEKNKKYCELTALYWIWKNDTQSTYMGLCHYRRHFEIDRNLCSKLEVSDIDVVVTIPILNFPDVKTMYKNDHCEEDWNIMLDAVKKLSPEFYDTAVKVGNKIYYYAYNMFIAKRDVFVKYCEWLFPILNYCEEHCKVKNDKYQDRVIGFLAERLLTIFLTHNKSKLKIVHAKKNFLMN